MSNLLPKLCSRSVAETDTFCVSSAFMDFNNSSTTESKPHPPPWVATKITPNLASPRNTSSKIAPSSSNSRMSMNGTTGIWIQMPLPEHRTFKTSPIQNMSFTIPMILDMSPSKLWLCWHNSSKADLPLICPYWQAGFLQCSRTCLPLWVSLILKSFS